MNFGDILAEWENLTPENKLYARAAEKIGAGRRAGADTERGTGGKNSSAERRRRLLHKKPDAVIDLHGLTSDEAWIALEAFFEDSRRRGFEKLQIIHGKGTHGAFVPGAVREGVLRELSRRFIETCSYAGESGLCHAREGGTGATWVILKERNYG